jgi:hypothetical protein
VIGAAIALLGVGAAPATAAELIGSPLTGAPTNLICGGCDASAVELAAPSGSTFPLSPTKDGVVVSVRVRYSDPGAAPDNFGLTLLTAVGGTVFNARQPDRLPVFSPPANAPAGTLEIVPKDASGNPRGVLIHSTERLGMFEDNDPGHSGPAVLSAPVTGAQTGIVLGIQNSGPADYSIVASNADLLVQATVEPDADGDEYGDETQDQCPTNGSTHGPCPTGQRAAALAKCKKRAHKHRWSHKRLKKCKRKANLLPV